MTIDELRTICQGKGDKESEVKMTVWRHFSIYFTKILITIGFSANQTTILGTLIIILGFTFLLLDNLVGIALFVCFIIIGTILDNSDGEIARYRESPSQLGLQVELISHEIQYSIFFPFIGWISFQTTGNLLFLVLGFISALTKSMFERNMISLNRTLRELKGDQKLKIANELKKVRNPILHLIYTFYLNIYIAPYCYFIFLFSFLLSLVEFYVIFYAIGLTAIYIVSLFFGLRLLRKNLYPSISDSS